MFEGMDLDFVFVFLNSQVWKFDRKLHRKLMKKARKITFKNGVGNWVLFFVGLERWKMEARGSQEFENRGPIEVR